jgi:DNA-binding NarL/FixJ family response regulator
MIYGPILIADDHEVVRSGLAILVSRMLPQTTILQTESLDGAIALLKQQRVELALCDVNMPGGNHYNMLHQLKAVQPDLKILVITAYQTVSHEKRYLQEGANGYLSKSATNEEIQQAVSSILQNGYYRSSNPETNREQVVAHWADQSATALLSYREVEVARLLTKGLGILEIANALNLRTNTVSTYKKRIFTKLDVANIPELISLLNSYSDWQSE